jgi:phosphate transport system substrate-binding protein
LRPVATYENQPDALGYSYYYFVVDMWGNENVRLMKVDNVYPDNSTIASKQYPIVTSYYAVFRKSEVSGSPVRKVVDWILSDAGQKLAEDSGYVKVR